MEESAITRIMPNSLEAEQSVVGSMIMDRQAIITAGEMLSADDFYHKQYGIMFQTMIDISLALIGRFSLKKLMYFGLIKYQN